ncbi:hypothetical protein ACFFGH_30500 [Lysobacter korlensis]|uniref:Uncharacterized protein n=1 Tax=Lysobacter korlensis TaxID=553636 RepID=A0ABV6S243_9GAMM
MFQHPATPVRPSTSALSGGSRPLHWLAAAMAILAVVCTIALFVDQRTLDGAPLWAKPLKFALSVLIYSVTLSWLIGLVRRGRRVVGAAATVAAVFLTVELVIIVGVAATGGRSHFNVATPLATTLWSVMATSIVLVWLATLVIAGVLFRAALGDRARTLAVRAGLGIAIVGMALGFLMTSPTAQQLDDFQGIAGAHTVGAADGGAGLFLLGWSTEAGDLRIPHFVGMHALQLIPLAAIVLELAARRIRVLREPQVRARLMWVAIGLYAGVLALLTAQALLGQPIVRPEGPVLVAGLILFAAALAAAALVVGAAVRSWHAEPLPTTPDRPLAGAPLS